MTFSRQTEVSPGPLAYVAYFTQCRKPIPEPCTLLDKVLNSSYYGIAYRSTCTTNRILCCPNSKLFYVTWHSINLLVHYLHGYSTMWAEAIGLPSNTSNTLPLATSSAVSSPTTYSAANILQQQSLQLTTAYVMLYPTSVSPTALSPLPTPPPKVHSPTTSPISSCKVLYNIKALACKQLLMSQSFQFPLLGDCWSNCMLQPQCIKLLQMN